MYKEFLDFCKKKYPFTDEAFRAEAPSPNLFSFRSVNISQSHLRKIQKFIQTTYELRDNPEYQTKILGQPIQHKNYSVLMSFDFHIHDDQIKLIETNTNASHFLTSYLMSDFVLKEKPPIEDSLTKLKESFLEEWKLFGASKKLERIALVDENPEAQKAHFEFILYKKLFEEMGLQCHIEDSHKVNVARTDLVYNRDTDFYFEKLPALKKAYDEELVCVTPHPEEYKLLADKNRLLQLSDSNFLKPFLSAEQIELFGSIVPKIFEINSLAKEAVWDLRKKYFFKPKNAFGGKGVFRGLNMTHKVFDQAYSAKNYLAQELAPAGEITIHDQMGITSAKWDLRVYVYRGEIQHLTARAYVGQTTNFRTLGGGFAAVKLI